MIEHEAAIRVVAFATVLGAFGLLERMIPWRVNRQPGHFRWSQHLGLVALDTVLLRIVFPTASIGVAALAGSRDWGLLNRGVLDPIVAIVAGVVLLDLAIWAQHRLFHASPALWRLHGVHHVDTELDVTTGIRFHPLEILLSMAIKMLVVVALGVPALAVLIFEVLLNATSMFSHANLRMPRGLERALRGVLVTPAMHRVHHSMRRDETNSNFGFCLSWWDRLFGTYRAQSVDGPEQLTLGLPRWREPGLTRLDRLVTLPFRRGPFP